MANYKIFSHLRLPGNGLVTTAILSSFQERVNKGDLDGFSVSSLMSELGEKEETIIEALKQLAKFKRIPAPTCPWDEVDELQIIYPAWQIQFGQKRLDYGTERERNGYEVRTIADIPYRVEVAVDIEDRTKKKHFLNVWRVGDDGLKTLHVIRAQEFPDKGHAWSFWDRYATLLGWPCPSLRWAMDLATDRTYTDKYGEQREVVYVDVPALAAIREDVKRKKAEETDLSIPGETLDLEDPDVASWAHRDFAVAWMGTSLPEDLAQQIQTPEAAEAERTAFYTWLEALVDAARKLKKELRIVRIGPKPFARLLDDLEANQDSEAEVSMARRQGEIERTGVLIVCEDEGQEFPVAGEPGGE